MALEFLKITGSQPYYLNRASTAEELVYALEDYMRTGTQIIFQHDGDDCILTSYEYNTDENKVIAYFVTPKKKLLKVDIGAGWDLVITESEFTPETDTTLTQSGKPADAKKTGERFMVFEENVLGYMDEIRDLISSKVLNTQEKTVDITENGTVEVTPDEGYALSKVTANVNVGGGASAYTAKSIDELPSNAPDGSMAIVESDSIVGKWEWNETIELLEEIWADGFLSCTNNSIHNVVGGDAYGVQFDNDYGDVIEIAGADGNVHTEYREIEFIKTTNTDEFVSFAEWFKQNATRISGGNSLYIRENGEWVYKCEIA